MDDTALEAAYHCNLDSLRSEEAPDGSPGEAVFPLTGRASLLVALLLSLGLWAAIWAAVTSLSSALLG